MLSVLGKRSQVTGPESTEHWVRKGNQVLLSMTALFFAFGLVSISGAVVATGVVNVESNYKTVQHLDGGIVSKILVRNGDRVQKGDVLVRLEDTSARANLAVAVAKMNDLLVQKARLEAERDRAEAVALPREVEAHKADPALAQTVKAQLALFSARTAAHHGDLDVLRKRVEQSTNEVAGIRQMLQARKKEAEISAKELATIRPLYDRGFANQQRLLPVQRENARLEGEVGRLTSELAKANSALSEAQLKKTQAEREFTQQVVDELRKVQSALTEVAEQRTTLEDKLRRIDIAAPRAGRVHALAVHTEGGVIAPGSPIMQIIPDGERLIVDAQIPPSEIDKVRDGQPAYVRFPAFNARTTPRLDGTVIGVSAAQLTDNQNNRSYFTVQVALADGELQRLPARHALVPGMPAEVYIETGDRSIMSYFLKPLTDALARTFRES
ncbi:MAG: HlyD family type I secretion periplasmic adaptor subunit [Hyphomicrobiaceae bacterium]